MINKHYCPKCETETEFKYYHGCLGYESFKCVVCDFDINEVSALDLDKLYNKIKVVLK
jgi:transposase-like protein